MTATCSNRTEPLTVTSSKRTEPNRSLLRTDPNRTGDTTTTRNRRGVARGSATRRTGRPAEHAAVAPRELEPRHAAGQRARIAAQPHGGGRRAGWEEAVAERAVGRVERESDLPRGDMCVRVCVLAREEGGRAGFTHH